MSLELITQDEFIRKYIPAETKEKKQAFARKKQDCLDMGYTDVFIKPYHNQIFVNERRYQDFLIEKSQRNFEERKAAALTAAKF